MVVCRYFPVNDSQAFENELDETICAVMIELVQGEGRVTALSKEYAVYIAKVCKEKDILLIGVVLMDQKTENVFQTGHNGLTFDGNPVVCTGCLSCRLESSRFM